MFEMRSDGTGCGSVTTKMPNVLKLEIARPVQIEEADGK
jgi:hypothetical protein